MALTRRQTLAALGAAPAGMLIHQPSALARLPSGWLGRRLSARAPGRSTPQAAEGPFYVENRLERRSLAEGRPGLPLELFLRLVDANHIPLAGKRVDVWHADATGCYSGFQGQGDERTLSTVGQTFLRGTQLTDSGGAVRFLTIYPGWYAGRTAHVHVKIFVDDGDVFDGQIYFPDDLNRFVFTTVPPYCTRSRRRDTFNRNDPVLAGTRPRRPYAEIWTSGERLGASLTIVLAE